MSVWKKASKANQKTHRERHQPEHRKHLGLLEKKKDYVLRAKDFNEKQETIKLLRKRALNKNPDEFYHHMINSKTNKDGVHHDKDTSDDHTQEQIKLMETQDIRYVNMKRTLEMKKVERLQSQLHLIDVKEKPKNTHKLFFDSKKDAEEFQKKKEEESNISNYSLEELAKQPLINYDPEVIEHANNQRLNMYRELGSRIKREKELSVIQQKLDIKKHLQTKKKRLPPTKVRTGTKETPPVYKWKFQRQK